MHWDYAITSRSKKEACPYGTIPIHRTTDEDEEERATNPSNEMFHHIGHINFGSGSSYNVTVAQDQSSFGTVLVQNGPPDRPNILAAGWTVSPTGIATLDCLSIGPYVFDNLEMDKNRGALTHCARGFKEINPNIGPKTCLSSVSIYGGTTYDYQFMIYQDTITGNWWFVVQERTVIWYRPKEIVGESGNGASEVAWRGLGRASKDGTNR
nr:uncharacterized protein LOC107403365 [Ziziphus jujuba var. spinosa]